MPSGPQPRATPRPGSIAAGLVLAVLALFMTPLALREIATAMTRGGFVKDELELGHYSAGRNASITGRVLSTGEVVTTQRTYLVGLEKLAELRQAGKIEGYRAPIWYLPAQGVWQYVDQVSEFRVQTPNEFEAGFSVVVLALSGGLYAAAIVLITRGLGTRRAVPGAPAGA